MRQLSKLHDERQMEMLSICTSIGLFITLTQSMKTDLCETEMQFVNYLTKSLTMEIQNKSGSEKD